MQWVQNLLMVVQVLSAIGVIGLVLVQHGKGADMGAAFGSGASGSLFGATGSANFLSRTTAVLAAVFFLSTLGLALVVGHRPEAPASVMDTVPTGAAPAANPNAAPSDVPGSGSDNGSGNASGGSAPGSVPGKASDATAVPGTDTATQKNQPASDIPK